MGNSRLLRKPRHLWKNLTIRNTYSKKKKKNRTFQDFQWFPMLCCGPKSEPPMFFGVFLEISLHFTNKQKTCVFVEGPALGRPMENQWKSWRLSCSKGRKISVCFTWNHTVIFHISQTKNVSYLSLRNCRPWNQKWYIYTLHICKYSAVLICTILQLRGVDSIRFKLVNMYIYIYAFSIRNRLLWKCLMYKEPKHHGVDLHLDGFGMFQGWVEVPTASRSFQFSKSERPESKCLSCTVIEPGRCSIP